MLNGTTVLKCLCGILLLLNLLAVYSIFFSAKGLFSYRRQRQHVAEVGAEIQKLQEQNRQLFATIQQLKQDPVAQERLVRQQLGWVHDNEWVIEFLPSHPNDAR